MEYSRHATGFEPVTSSVSFERKPGCPREVNVRPFPLSHLAQRLASPLVLYSNDVRKRLSPLRVSYSTRDPVNRSESILAVESSLFLGKQAFKVV